MEKAMRKQMGIRLRDARNNASISAQDVAARFKVSVKTVYAWEAGGGTPNPLTFRNLCRLYKMSADEILWGEDPDAPKPGGLTPALLLRIGRLDPKMRSRLEATLKQRLDELEGDINTDLGKQTGT